MTQWHKASWREHERIQMPDYPDKNALQRVEAKLSTYPPLVFSGEVMTLREKLAEVCRGDAFLLQGVDCAESFDEFGADILMHNRGCLTLKGC